MSVVSDSTREKALDALDGMAQIVRKEMLTWGEYVSQDVDPDKATSICGGHQYCAVGSLWAGAGVKAKKCDGTFYLPGVQQGTRSAYLRRHPGLRAAYDALNASADRYISRHKIANFRLATWYSAPIESLFEAPSVDIGRAELLRIIASAKRSLKAQP